MITYPLISICIPAFNCEEYISQTLDCLCGQTYPNLEFIVADDGSSDATLRIVSAYKDHRIKILSLPNNGAASARNCAFKESLGDYIIFFDADDYIKPDFIWQQFYRIMETEETVVVAAWGRFYNGDINACVPEEMADEVITFKDWIKRYWYYCNPMTNPGRVLIPRKTIIKAGLWDERLTLNDDLEFFTRVFLNTQRIILNTSAMFYYRSGISGLSALKNEEAYSSLLQSILLSIHACLSHYRDNTLHLSYANMLQSYIYLSYPAQKHLIASAKHQISRLAKPNLKFQSSGYTKYLVFFLGWRATKRIKMILNKHL